MSLADGFRHRLRPLFRRRDFDREMDQEFRHHIELQAQEFPDGVDPAARARARFGSQAWYMEETRRMTPLGWLDALGQDLRYAWRNLRRTPAFTIVAVLSLAIGIGANSAIFGLLYAVLLQPLPVSHAEQLFEVQHTGPELPNDAFSYSEYQSLRRSPGFTSVTALGGSGDVAIVAGAVRRSVGVDGADGNFFSTIGLRPLLGRLISPDDERARASVVVISEDLWTELFNRARTAIGSTIRMQESPFTVIGIVPKSYQGLGYPGSFETAVPLSALPLVGGNAAETTDANTATLQIIGRLADPGAAVRVGGTVNTTWRSCCAANATSPGAAGTSGLRLVSIEHGIPSPKFNIAAMFGRLFVELMGGAVVVLLAACANIGTLLLARASARERELAVRLSLGASRRRLATQMLVESGVLAAIGSAAGLVLAWGALRLIAHRLPAPIIARVGLHLNGEILGFTALVAAASVLLFGGIPAWRATRTNLIAPLKEAGHSAAVRRAGWLDRSVVVAQVVLALVLVNAAGLLVATLRNLRSVNGGFMPERVVSAEFDARDTPYETVGLGLYTDRLLARATLVPGVRSAALALAVPVFGGRRDGENIDVEGYTPRQDENMQGWFNTVTPGYFSTLGIRLLRGRDFSQADRGAGQQVAIVNEAFVHQYIRNRNPLGTHIRTTPSPPRNRNAPQGSVTTGVASDSILLQIVGVVGDARYADLREPASPMIYVPLAQFEQVPAMGRIDVLSIAVRTAGDDGGMPGPLRNALQAVVPGLQIYGPETIEASIDESLNRETLTAELATLFGAVALILAAIGLYGIVSYHVAQRVREIGVRMALGAASSSVVWMVLRQALVLVTIGVLVGAPLAIGGGKAIAAELYGLAGQSRLFVLGAGVLLIGVAVAASALPARRAARVDPLIALRAD
ncbi:MAG: ADOP family duplicated permease [Gemmatimonadales bacterium]